LAPSKKVEHAHRLAIRGIANEIGHADRRFSAVPLIKPERRLSRVALQSPSYIRNLANAPTVTDMINPDHIPGSCR
jgi:hypothetical protein